jgi:hypothetical protein
MEIKLNGFCNHGNPALDCIWCKRAAETGGTQPTDNQQLKPKMPLLEEVQQAYCAIPGDGEATSMGLGAIGFCYEYITRHFGR